MNEVHKYNNLRHRIAMFELTRIAYEMLFRSSRSHHAGVEDDGRATAQVMLNIMVERDYPLLNSGSFLGPLFLFLRAGNWLCAEMVAYSLPFCLARTNRVVESQSGSVDAEVLRLRESCLIVKG